MSRAIPPTMALGITKMLEIPWPFFSASSVALGFTDFSVSELAVSESVTDSVVAADVSVGSSSVAVSDASATAAARIAVSSPAL